MVTIKFGKPHNATSTRYDCVVLDFPLEVVYPGVGSRRDSVSKHVVSVDMSGHLACMWGFVNYGSDPLSLAPTLFQVAKEEVFRRLIAGTLANRQTVPINTRTGPMQNPYDPEKLVEPADAAWQIDIDQARADSNSKQGSRPIGFTLPHEEES